MIFNCVPFIILRLIINQIEWTLVIEILIGGSNLSFFFHNPIFWLSLDFNFCFIVLFSMLHVKCYWDCNRNDNSSKTANNNTDNSASAYLTWLACWSINRVLHNNRRASCVDRNRTDACNNVGLICAPESKQLIRAIEVKSHICIGSSLITLVRCLV
jgi:hypothetical protein